jgi:hypothetical protein
MGVYKQSLLIYASNVELLFSFFFFLLTLDYTKEGVNKLLLIVKGDNSANGREIRFAQA